VFGGRFLRERGKEKGMDSKTNSRQESGEVQEMLDPTETDGKEETKESKEMGELVQETKTAEIKEADAAEGSGEKERSKENDGREQGKWGKKELIFAVSSALLVVIGAAALIMLYNVMGRKVECKGDGWYQAAARKEPENISEAVSGLDPFGAMDSGTSSMAENWDYGNDMQIYISGGLIAADEEYYYAANKLDGNRLYRISRDGSFNREKISDIPVGALNLCGEKLYFVNNYANAGYDMGIYRINTDGTGLEYLSDVVPDDDDLILVNSWLYYINGNDSHIYKMNTETRRELCLTDKRCIGLAMHENTIYYTYRVEDEEGDYEYVLASMDVDGNGHFDIARGSGYYNFTYMDGKVYYVSFSEDAFCCINPDGTDQQTVMQADIKEYVGVYDGGCYYIDASQNDTLAVYREESGETRHYNIENVKDFYVIDGMLWINYMEGAEEKVSVHDLADGSLIPFFQ